jgi:hypothetical protein
MTLLDTDRVRELFDLRGSYVAASGGGYDRDPYPIWNALREAAPVHAGTLHELSAVEEPYAFHGLPYSDRPHFTVLTYEACDVVYRDNAVFASSPVEVDLDGEPDAMNSMLTMNGARHRRYRALVQPSTPRTGWSPGAGPVSPRTTWPGRPGSRSRPCTGPSEARTGSCWPCSRRRSPRRARGWSGRPEPWPTRWSG